MNGTDGSDGSNGLNSLVATSTELPGSNCANGGTKIDVGLDEDSDGILELDEIEQTQYVCQGVGSNNTILTSTSTPPLSMGCDAGGRVIAHGLDNGDGGGISANGILESGEIDSTTTFCSRFVIELLTDIHPGIMSSNADHLTFVGDTLYFEANNGLNGTELWKSDGTASGTLMVKEINPGIGNDDLSLLTAVGNNLFFRANDGIHGTELWKSDGFWHRYGQRYR